LGLINISKIYSAQEYKIALTRILQTHSVAGPVNREKLEPFNRIGRNMFLRKSPERHPC
jgi:hypothetical protein